MAKFRTWLTAEDGTKVEIPPDAFFKLGLASGEATEYVMGQGHEESFAVLIRDLFPESVKEAVLGEMLGVKNPYADLVKLWSQWTKRPRPGSHADWKFLARWAEIPTPPEVTADWITDDLRPALVAKKRLEADHESKVVTAKTLGGEQQSVKDGPLEPDGFRFDGKPAWRLTPDEKKLMTFVWSKRDDPPTWIDTAFHLCPTKRVNGLPVASSQDFYTVLNRLKTKLVEQGWKAWIHFAGRGATTRGKVVLRVPVKRSKSPAAKKRRSTVSKPSNGSSSNKRPAKKKRASNA